MIMENKIDFFERWQEFTPEVKQRLIRLATHRVVSDRQCELRIWCVEDARHGWAIVPKKAIILLGLKISRCSYEDDGLVFLEEDRDLYVIMEKMKEMGKTIVFIFQEDGYSSRIRNFNSYKESQ